MAITPIATARAATSSGRSSTWRIARPPTRSPTLAGSASTSAATAEPALGEAPVVRQRVPEVADADDDDRPVLGEPQLAADLVDQVRDVVAHAAGAVGAEVREVLADLRRVHAGGLGQRLGGDRGGALLREVDEAAQVDGQPRRRWPRGSSAPSTATARGRCMAGMLARRERVRKGTSVPECPTSPDERGELGGVDLDLEALDAVDA